MGLSWAWGLLGAGLRGQLLSPAPSVPRAPGKCPVSEGRSRQVCPVLAPKFTPRALTPPQPCGVPFGKGTKYRAPSHTWTVLADLELMGVRLCLATSGDPKLLQCPRSPGRGPSGTWSSAEGGSSRPGPSSPAGTLTSTAQNRGAGADLPAPGS